MWILLVMVIAASGETQVGAYGNDGAPHKFKSLAACQAKLVEVRTALAMNLPADTQSAYQCKKEPLDPAKQV